MPLKWHFTDILEAGLATERACAWSPKDLGSSLTLRCVPLGKSLHQADYCGLLRVVMRVKEITNAKCPEHCLTPKRCLK